MFTLEQVKAAHGKVKSGADFPAYIAEMRSLGVNRYEHFVSDGHIRYYGAGDYVINAAAKWQPLPVAGTASKDALQHSLQVHQQGQTDYRTFCNESAEAGVEKWIVDMQNMTCTYYDKQGNTILEEDIPGK